MSSLRALQQPPPYAGYLSLTYWPDAPRLEARWLRPVSSAEYRAGYQSLLAKALETDCSFWLVDVRRRTSPSEADGCWLLNEFMPQLPGSLGGSLFIGTLYPPGFVAPPSPAHPRVPDAHVPAPNLLLRNFSDEELLTHWLRQCRRARA
ncbi:MAG: hypothetical protein M3Y54_04655 [Bacteroidota bacterium]|nr:hypothetical protein [Bacteroidota bacterium]